MKFSILTACRNASPFLKDYFDGVLSQSYPDMEVIFVDDASKDNSLEIARRIGDDRVKTFSIEIQSGCGSAYKYALEQATGDICGVVDADDKLGSEAISRIVNRYKRHPNIGFIYTQHYWCDKNLKVLRKGLSSAPECGSLIESVAKGQHCFSHWRTFRTSLRKKADIFRQGSMVSVDKEMGFILEGISRGAFLPKTMYYYRYHPKNMSLTSGRNQKKQTRRLVKWHQNQREGKKSFPIRVIS